MNSAKPSKGFDFSSVGIHHVIVVVVVVVIAVAVAVSVTIQDTARTVHGLFLGKFPVRYVEKKDQGYDQKSMAGVSSRACRSEGPIVVTAVVITHLDSKDGSILEKCAVLHTLKAWCVGEKAGKSGRAVQSGWGAMMRSNTTRHEAYTLLSSPHLLGVGTIAWEF